MGNETSCLKNNHSADCFEISDEYHSSCTNEEFSCTGDRQTDDQAGQNDLAMQPSFPNNEKSYNFPEKEMTTLIPENSPQRKRFHEASKTSTSHPNESRLPIKIKIRLNPSKANINSETSTSNDGIGCQRTCEQLSVPC